MPTNIFKILSLLAICGTVRNPVSATCPKECLCGRILNTDNLQFICTFHYLSDDLDFNVIQNTKLQDLTIKCESDLLFGSLRDHAFSGMTNLQILSIQSCSIKTIDLLTFEGLQNLHTLELDSIGTEHGGTVMTPGWSDPLESLQFLTVKGSKISGFDEDEFCGRSQLISIDLSVNSLSHIQDIGIMCPKYSLRNGSNHLEQPGINSTSLNESRTDLIRNTTPPLLQLILSHNKIQVLDIDWEIYAPNLKVLIVDNNGLKSIKENTSHIFNLNLQLLVLRNNALTRITLPEDRGINFASLVELDLSGNKISYLPQGFFRSAVKLQTLNLSSNLLTSETVEQAGIAALVNVKHLDLANNPLKTLGKNMTETLEEILVLDISNCELSVVEFGALQRLKLLQKLNISSNYLTVVRNLTLSTFKLLTYLNLDSNQFHDLTMFLGLPQLSHVSFRHNNLPNFPKFYGLWDKLNILDAEGNLFQHLDSNMFRNTGQLVALRLSKNNITSIRGYTFSHLSQLTVLNLAENNINFIDYSAFKGLNKLLYLKLDHNKIMDLDVYLFPLTSLTHLFLRGNDLTVVPSGMMPNNLQLIDLAHNNIRGIMSGAFKMMPHLRAVDLTDNAIRTITEGALQMSRDTWPRPQVFFRGNRMECDCDLVWFRKINSYSRHPYFFHPLVPDLSLLACTERLASGFWLAEVKDSDLLCSYPTECYSECNCCDLLNPGECPCRAYCFEECSCLRSQNANINIMDCTGKNVTKASLGQSQRPLYIRELHLDNVTLNDLQADMLDYELLKVLYLNNSQVKMIPPGVFKKLPSLKVMYLQDNELLMLKNDTFGNLSTLGELHLQRNYITDVDPATFTHLPSLKILNLFDNRLKRISLDLFNTLGSLVTLTLYDNPFECDCSFGVKFKSFLSANANKIHRVQDIICLHDSQNNFTDWNSSSLSEPVIKIDFGYCRAALVREVISQRSATTWVITVVAIFVVLIILSVCVYRNRFLLQVWLYNKYGCFGRDDENDESKPYDMYVTCAEQDEEFMFEQIVPQLEEGKYSYKLCLEPRDWPAGEFRMDSIIASTMQSKRTLLLVTPNYFRDEWSQFAFRTAHHQVLLEKKMHLVLVILDQSLTSKMDANMRLYMRTNFYLDLSDKWFWEKLKYYLPDEPRGGREGQEDLGQAGQAMRTYTLLNMDVLKPERRGR